MSAGDAEPAVLDDEVTEEDLPRMSLLDHLDELRRRILYSVIAIFVAFLGSWYFAPQIFHWLEQPFLDAVPAGLRGDLAVDAGDAEAGRAGVEAGVAAALLAGLRAGMRGGTEEGQQEQQGGARHVGSAGRGPSPCRSGRRPGADPCPQRGRPR